jgi:hypothetical protein
MTGIDTRLFWQRHILQAATAGLRDYCRSLPVGVHPSRDLSLALEQVEMALKINAELVERHHGSSLSSSVRQAFLLPTTSFAPPPPEAESFGNAVPPTLPVSATTG